MVLLEILNLAKAVLFFKLFWTTRRDLLYQTTMWPCCDTKSVTSGEGREFFVKNCLFLWKKRMCGIARKAASKRARVWITYRDNCVP